MMLQVTFALPNGITVKAIGEENPIRRLTAAYTLIDETLLPPQAAPALRVTFTLPHTGTWFAVEGVRSDIAALLDHYSRYPWMFDSAQRPRALPPNKESERRMQDNQKKPKKVVIPPRKPLGAPPPAPGENGSKLDAPKFAGEEIDPQWLAEKAADCEESDVLFPKVFNTTNQTDRVLAVLYVLYKYVNPVSTLTAREISEALEELGAPMQPTNISKVFRTEARSMVVKDSTGRAARFRLNPNGVKTVERILAHNPLL